MPKDALVSYTAPGPDGLVTASLSGELDLDTADRVRDGLVVAARQNGCRYLDVDVSALAFIDSYALGALVSAHTAATAAGVALRLRNPSAPVRKAVEVTGLAAFFGV